jgi:hypothetical protein
MKALSVKNPWADWIVFGFPRLGEMKIKTTENRTWKTPYRGRIFIHVSKQFDENGVDFYFHNFGHHIPDDEDRQYWQNQSGMIIGSVELYAIDNEIKTEWDEEGLFHWRLRNPQPLDRAILVRGSLGLWEYKGEL